MITIRNWRDMDKYGFNLLTGEACGLGYRGLFDLTAPALEIVKRVIGAVELTTPSDYNGHGAVGSLLLPYAMFEPLAVFALFMRENAQYVVIEYGADTYTYIRILGLDGSFPRDVVETQLQGAGITNYRILTYPEQRPGVTVGMSNTHQMSGRTA